MDNNPPVSSEFLGLQAAVAGRYSLDAEIGRGGMGIVYRAKDVTLDRVVAIKLLPPKYSQQPDIHERFLKEARTAARLSHPNIVPIFSVEESDGFVFFVMAYVDGETLAERVARTGVLNPNDAARIFREVAWALSYAHAQQLVHRDIKPDNIMLENKTGRALVMDFGIAGDTTDETGMVLGTPHFMSPEQASGENLASASDLYSLGATLYFALSGQPPFDGDDSPSILAHHIRTTPQRLSKIAPGTPTKLSGIAEKCLAKEPTDRFTRAEEIAEQLDRSIETKKEIPVAVRAFVTNAKERRGGFATYIGFYIALMSTPIIFGSLAVAPSVLVLLGMVAAAAAIPGLYATTRARHLMTAGFDRLDLVRALEAEYQLRVEELPFIYGDANESIAATFKFASNLALTLGVAGVALGPIAGLIIPTFSWTVPFGLLSATLGVLLRGAASRRMAGREKRRMNRWKGLLGKWIFRLAGFKLTRQSDAARLTYRPTEMAVGMAVLGLYETLPDSTKDTLGDLPAVVSGLEQDAKRMRQRVAELDEVLSASSVHENPSNLEEDSLAGQRTQAVASVRDARQQAATRLADAVAALETLRVDLLRIRVGEVSLDSVTYNLGAAREIAEQVDRLVTGQDEVSKL